MNTRASTKVSFKCSSPSQMFLQACKIYSSIMLVLNCYFLDTSKLIPIATFATSSPINDIKVASDL